MIFTYSGTGNSEYAARALLDEGEALISIPRAVREGRWVWRCAGGERVGFVFPVYFFGLPATVLDFVRRVRFSGPVPYVYAVITCGAFDSQNTIFYDTVRKCYVAHSRTFDKGRNGMMLRAIQRQTSPDAIHWSEPETLDFGEADPDVELYTNAIHPYWYNPSIIIGLPKRFTRDRASVYDHSGAGGMPGVSDGLFMSSRDGIRFHRWDEAFVRPGIQHERWVNRNNMSAQGVVPTRPFLEGTPPELSIYSTEGYYGDKPNRLRRLAIRQDGFVSVQAPMSGGSFTMKPLTVDGKTLRLNASTSGAGEISGEIRDERNVPIPGYTLAESLPVFGDELDLVMTWQNGTDLTPLAGRRVVLHFELKDADIYSLRFETCAR